MAQEQRHIIQKQILEIQVAQAGTAEQERLALGDLFREYLLPVFEEVCDACSPSGALHRLDKVEINLGRIDKSSENLQQILNDFRNQLINVLSKQARLVQAGPNQISTTRHSHEDEKPGSSSGLLHITPGSDRQIQSQGATNAPITQPGKPRPNFPLRTTEGLPDNAEFGRDEAHITLSQPAPLGDDPTARREFPADMLFTDMGNLPPSDDIPLSSIRVADSWTLQPTPAWELFFHFLHKGRLPWWADNRGNKFLLSESIAIILRAFPEQLKQVLKPKLREEAVYKRLIVEFDDQILKSLLRLWQQPGVSNDWPATWLVLIEPLHIALEQPRAKVRYWIWELLWANAALDVGMQPITSETQLQHLLSEHLAARTGRSKVAIYALFEKIPGLYTKGRMEERQMPIDPFGKEDELSGTVPSNPLAPATTASLKSPQSPFPRFSESEEIYLANAGLVILGPYLARYFELQGWVQEKEFVSTEAQQRAILALQFLADGSVEAPEYDLSLNKLLSGWPLETPLDPQEPLNEDEQAAAEVLLTAVIGHAKVLRDMSPESFRNTFLRREGVLKYNDPYWLLRVKRETYDIVLDQFSWSFNIIKLPWMATTLYVEW